ncbi:MAG: MG2 domain-containing protein [Byssovorax sp.]
MATPRIRSFGRLLGVLFVGGSSLVCSGSHPALQAPPPSGPGPLFVQQASSSTGALLFPPADTERSPRSALEGSYSLGDRTAKLEVSEPSVDGKSHFAFTGTMLHIVFNQPVTRPAPEASAKGKKKDGPIPAARGTVKIVPEVAMTAVWIDDRTLEVRADKAFDEQTAYAIEVGDVTTPGGVKLAAPWKATFTASPSFIVAGKELGYIPTRGEHRVVAVQPFDESRVSRRPVLAAIYDQPIDLGLGHKLLTLEYPKGGAIPFAVEHPAGPTFQGIKVDPRHVLLIKPSTALKAGASARLTAGDWNGEGAPKVTNVNVVDALQSTDISCGYGYYDSDCRFTRGVLETSGKTVHVLFNNALGTPEKELPSRVRVTPFVKNLTLRADSWGEGRLMINGQFEPSRTYDVTIDGLRDQYEQTLGAPIKFKIQTPALSASITMPEGLLLLDEATSKRFVISTRNVSAAEVVAYPVPAGAAELDKAIAKARAREIPEGGTPLVIPVTIKAERDKVQETAVDLTSKLAAGTSYLTMVRATGMAFDAEPMRFPSGSEAEKPSVALLQIGSPKTLAAHVRSYVNGTLVQVTRLGSGEPVSGAEVRFEGDEAPRVASTDAHGLALLPSGASRAEGFLRVNAADADLLLPMAGEGIGAKQLFPHLVSGIEPGAADRRAMILTDRGIYRPGSTAFLKASLRRPDGAKLLPIPGSALVLRIVGPTGDEAMRQGVTTDDFGSAAARFEVPSDAKLGRYQLRLEDPAQAEPPLASAMLQVAEFEVPRFAVDVDATTAIDKKTKAPSLGAVVHGRYLFGAPMDGAQVKWTLKRKAAPVPPGPLSEELLFRKRPSWRDGDEDDAGELTGKPWSRAGDGKLAPDGTLRIDQALLLDPALGPQEFSLEADVTDTSYRHVAGRASVTEHPVQRYAGLKLPKGWVDAGETFPVSLGVIDTEGKPVAGAKVTARLERIEWSYSERRGAGGASRWEWSSRRIDEGRCSVTSAIVAVGCSLRAAHPGDYELSAEVDGHKGGAVEFWAYHESDGEEGAAFPSKGHVLEVVTDKPRYRPGDVAKLLVRSPYPAATALLTVEQGALLDRRSVKITGGAAIFDLPLTALHAPYVHATVTLLPIGAKGEAVADYRIGAVRIPVATEASRLDLALRSDRPTYEPGQDVEITVEAKDDGKPEGRAEIALAVVDEGVLRLTGFHPPDPVTALRPGRALSFSLHDSRRGLGALFERSHTAGDGGGGEGSITSTRKDFVQTLLWKPDLRTDASGKATVRLRLPDNLTQFRMMAVALDDEGKGAVSEASFTVKKPVMLIPAVPRFASVGDRFEAAALLHNNTPDPITATVTMNGKSASATVSGLGKSRIGFPVEATVPGEMTLTFAAADGAGKVFDRVEQKLRVEEPGVDEHPSVHGAFLKHQEIALDVPADVRLFPGAALSVQVGQHLWPELGERLDYLLGYPHGCVEQTTSSTLPLIAARTILPRIGFARMSDEELKKRIKAGLDRLATMRTESGGLAYWPGGTEPNVYGTAYAMRAVVLGTQAGVEAPKGLLEGMREYLKAQLLGSSIKPEVQAAIAQSLGELGELPASAADALVDRRDQKSVFGQASLAIALHALGGQDDRVASLLDAVEASFDEQGKLLTPPRSDDFYYYGSPTRTKAQAAIALGRLRPSSRALPMLLSELAQSLDTYTTQAISYSLLALAEQLHHEEGAGASFAVTLDGRPLEPSRDLGGGAKEYRLPLDALRGRKVTLALASESDAALGFLVSGKWQRALGGKGSAAATRTPRSPEIYRVITDPKGGAIDLAKVKAGDVLRVALMIRLPVGQVDRHRLGYLAVTDRIAAGFEPVQPDLATVASAPEIGDHHPFSALLHGWDNPASYAELHDDRVQLYFDRTGSDELCATYLVRATTPGEFVLPPAAAELMYESNSLGYSESGRVVVQ